MNIIDSDNRITPIFLVITNLFVACLLISNIIAGKLIQVSGLTLPAGAIIFPVTYILSDVLTEVYGYRRTRLVIWIGFACNLLMATVFMVVIALPYPAFWHNQNAYATVLGMTPRLVAASLIAYWAGEFSNSSTLSAIKKLTGGRLLWVRTIGSTVIGQGVDMLIFITGSFYGLVPGGVLIQMVVAQYVFKVAYEIVVTPLTYLVVGRLKQVEKIDSFDWGVNYNPFRFKIK
ncbi:queuosine precursor transporter [Pelotomaculum terephthalicicum JT]|uniref:queuosine precursor transporter n=1 Tax=Pelotomaculum terephthalicicum TaxID=206393 RepID=UPI001F049A29|nr:queuosine precursor transporter [Pelotomaculum terephthalicicum]MCG9969922.1 queuosine precursor transporter [Pelotomaculum terephthalicicum JT]